MLNKKDLISINNKFSNGNIINKGSLDYLVDYTGKSKSWIKSLAHIVRALLIDHIFEDGNKRTALLSIVYYLEDKGYNYSINKVNNIIVKILKKNITSINEIERLIENVINWSNGKD
mgnify:CR=1 FL=1